MESDHRYSKIEFWAIVYANWTYEELSLLERVWLAFQDANLTA